jgi:outer membrane translocation and assembly module TamA
LGANIGGVLFHDMGNVYGTIGRLSFRWKQRDLNDFNYMVHAVGFGIRYRTPIGPIRGDLAYSDPNKPLSQLPSFCQSTRQTVGHFQFFFSIGQTF